MAEIIEGPGFRLEGERPDERSTPFHKRIIEFKPIPNTRTGNYVKLECGHVVQTFGGLQHAGGVLLCQECRTQAGK